MKRAWVLLFAAGCQGTTAGTSYVVPLAGQTAVATDTDLRVVGGAHEIPPDYPLDGVLRVVDLDDGGFVDGLVFVDTDADGAPMDLRFHATGGFRPNRHYAWTVDPAAGTPHGPEVPIPENLVGTAAFYTTDEIEALGVALDEGNRPCIVFSREMREEDLEDFHVTVNDVDLDDVGLSVMPPDTWAPPFVDPGDGEPYVDVWCVDSASSVAVEAEIRVWLGSAGPWWFEIGEDSIEDVVTALHRGEP